jgi:hypothetical protein
MLSHVPPLCVDALAVKLVARVALTVRLCDAGAAPPAVALKFSEVGLSVIVVEGCAIAKLTPTVCVPRDVRREMVPLYVPAESLAGFTETVRFWFVFSEPTGEMLNQFAPSF